MSSVGVFSDSDGNLERFDAALQRLSSLGARRFFFLGGRYGDLDEWVRWRRDRARAQVDYSNTDFLADVRGHLAHLPQEQRPAAFGTGWELSRMLEELLKLKDRVLRTPERGSLQYNHPSSPHKLMDMLGDTLVCLVHEKDDLQKDDLLNAAVLVHGNSPAPAAVSIGPRSFVTPGSLKGPNPTVGLLELGERGLLFRAVDLDGREALPATVLAQAARTKLSVK